jgi:1-acyl-sn-glycerol-3-phosphate acyltransferase
MSMYRFSRWSCGMLSRVVFRLEVGGIGNVPATGPVVLIPNHTSFLDPAFVGIGSPRFVRFMARSTLGHHRLFGWWMRKVGVILVDREAPARTSFAESIKVLEAGEAMAVFPEGTRSPDGRLGEFKKGVLKLLDKTGAIAVPTGIIGAFEAWPRHRKLPRPGRCRVHFGSPQSAAEVCAPGGLDRLREAVAALSGQELAPISTAGHGAGAPPRSLATDSTSRHDAAPTG